MTGALTFGGAGLAHATTYTSPAPETTTTLAQAQAEQDDDGDKTGLWGLAGLLGLLGLAGLKRRNDHVATTAAPGTAGFGNAPRA
jgi:MYXO-CTERM domain-containing protein